MENVGFWGNGMHNVVFDDDYRLFADLKVAVESGPSYNLLESTCCCFLLFYASHFTGLHFLKYMTFSSYIISSRQHSDSLWIEFDDE